MRQKDHGHPEAVEDLGADAVCAQCGTENPVGTFICRKCGNNLRDQRMLRLAADQELAGEGQRWGHRGIIRVVGSLLGVLLVLFTITNVERIAETLVALENRDQAEDTTLPFWRGEESAVYDRLAEALSGRSYRPETVQEYFVDPLPAQDGQGVFALATGTPPMRLRFVGLAQVERQGKQVYFAAQLHSGVEFRGVARSAENEVVLQWDHGAGDDGHERFLISGTAVPLPNGSYECFGESDISTEGYQFYAYRLP